MRRSIYAVSLLLAAPFVAGCAAEYKIPTSYDRGAKNSSTGQAPVPTTDSASPPSYAPEMSPSSGPSGEAPGLGPADEPAGEQPAGVPAAPYPPAPVRPTPPPPAPVGPRAVPPTPVQPAPSQPTPSQQPSIRLSAGVALPQSLPTGTAMGFSVDYEFTSGQPSPSSPYVWVVEPAKGQPMKQAVRLEDQGTLQGFILQFRPEHGPFETHIEDAHGNRLSRSLPLR